MRPSRLVVGSVLTAALALVALPGLAGSRVPSPDESIPASAFQTFDISARTSRSTVSIGPLDAAFGGAGATTTIFERAPDARPVLNGRPGVTQPDVSAAAARKPPLYTLSGYATFYDNGTTAMRLPRGTVVIICGDGGCIQRVVTDYGPQKPSRIVDLYRPDFFRICGCPSYSGTTSVKVYVY
jgi:hypothetical protein